MASWRAEELISRAETYAERNGLTLEMPKLGDGVHGIVFAANCQSRIGKSAIKVHARREYYERERDVYLRLRDRGVLDINGAHVPQLLNYDDDLLVLEMTIVTRPFVLDFAGAYLDEPPDYPEDVMEQWEAEKEEQFGEKWPDVQTILRVLRNQYGIHLLDVSPGNISFPE